MQETANQIKTLNMIGHRKQNDPKILKAKVTTKPYTCLWLSIKFNNPAERLTLHQTYIRSNFSRVYNIFGLQILFSFSQCAGASFFP